MWMAKTPQADPLAEPGAELGQVTLAGPPGGGGPGGGAAERDGVPAGGATTGPPSRGRRCWW